MEVHLRPELEAKLAEMAERQGRDGRALIEEAVERLIAYDQWFIEEVEKGLAAAARGEFVGDEEIRRTIGTRCPG